MKEEFEEAVELRHNNLMDIFEELSFSEKWQRVFVGLKSPHYTGDYKFAKLQLLRLSAPASAIIVPILLVLLLMICAVFEPEKREIYHADLRRPEPPPKKLDPIKPVKVKPPKLPKLKKMEFSFNDMNIPTPKPQPATPFSAMPTDISAVAVIKSPVFMKNIFGGPRTGGKGKAISDHGNGDPALIDAVLRTLRWFKKHQEDDGSWLGVPSGFVPEGGNAGNGKKSPVAMTSLVLLCYLAYGETPSSEEFGYTVESAIRFLVSEWRSDRKWPRRYEHAIAAYAMCEAYAMTRIPMVREVAEESVYVIVEGQNPAGGWRYTLKPTDESDTSCMGWCAQALKAAKMADLSIPNLDVALAKAVTGFKSNYGKKGNYGGFGYTSPGATGLTGAGVLCLQLLGAADHAETKNGLINLTQNATFNWEGGGTYNNNYFWYYITQAMFHAGGDAWTKWNPMFSLPLLEHQVVIQGAIEDTKGRMVDIGYWAMKKEITGHTAGVTMDTALACLQLEVYYRYLPGYKKLAVGDDAPEAIALPKENKDLKIDIVL